MSIKQRVAKLEESTGTRIQSSGPVIFLSDIYNEGAEAAIERWKSENAPVADNAFFIVLVAMQKQDYGECQPSWRQPGSQLNKQASV